jgi:aromatic ring-opening dioxygenase LigB subunit
VKVELNSLETSLGVVTSLGTSVMLTWSSIVVLVFFALARYRVVKIARSSYEVVLRTTKHMVIYPGSGPLIEGNTLHPMV